MQIKNTLLIGAFFALSSGCSCNEAYEVSTQQITKNFYTCEHHIPFSFPKVVKLCDTMQECNDYCDSLMKGNGK